MRRKKAGLSRFFIFRSTESVAAAAAVTATTFTVAVVMVMTMIVAVTTAAAVVAVIVVMVVTVRTMNVAMSQLFFGRFTDSNNFYVELQVLTSQHVVAVNHNVVVFNFCDFNRNRTTGQFQPRKRMPTCNSSTPMNTSLGTR